MAGQAQGIIAQIIPESNISIVKAKRIDRKKEDRHRPLCVTLRSKSEVIDVLVNKHKVSAPIRIAQDRTIKQRDHLLQLKARLKDMKDSGDKDSTINYFNGVPKIVKMNKSKNVAISH